MAQVIKGVVGVSGSEVVAINNLQAPLALSLGMADGTIEVSVDGSNYFVPTVLHNNASHKVYGFIYPALFAKSTASENTEYTLLGN